MLDIVKICRRTIEYSFYLLFFLVPLILTPWNYELFEFNKMLAVYFLTVIITGSWLIKAAAEKKFTFRRTFWDIPLLIFFGSQLLSYLFSIDRHTSLFGYYSRFNGGLLSVISYILLYWAFVTNMDKGKTQRACYYLLGSAALVAAYGILEHFGIDAKYWVQDVRNRVFSTLGQPNWLAAWLVALIPFVWALALNSKPYIYYLLFTICYFCLLFTGSRSGFLGFAVAFLAFWPLVAFAFRQKIKTLALPFSVFSSLFLVISLFTGTPYTPSAKEFFQKTQPPATNQPVPPQATENQTPLLVSESGDIRKIVWKGAVEIWRHYPILGTGPETFAYSYYWYRPREHNDVSEWDFLYNKAHNEYLNYLATTGGVGLGSYLVLIGSFIIWSLSKIKNSTLIIALLAGFSSIVVTNFFGFSVVPVSLLFFIFPAISVASNTSPTPDSKQQTPKLSSGQWLIILLLLLAISYELLAIVKYWQADTLFAQGLKFNKAGQYDQAFNVLRSAVKIRPGEPIYHDELAATAASLAVLAAGQKNATLTSQLEQMAVTESDTALKTSPYHLNFWKNRTKVFYSLKEIDEKYLQAALASLLRAAELAPTDPKIQYNLGLLYAGLGQQQLALQALQKTIELKPNYDAPHYALALFYEQEGNKQKAKEELLYILEKIDSKYQPALEKLKTL